MILSKKYDKIMERIEVTDEMKERILNNIQNEETKNIPSLPKIHLIKIEKILAIAACFAILITGVITVPNLIQNNGQEEHGALSGTNTIENVSSLAELSVIVGFSVQELTQIPFEVTEVSYVSYWGEMAQVTYQGEENTVIFRKSKGLEDNSGDYSEYEDETQIEVNNIIVTLKGGNQDYTLAIWNDGEYSYSIALSKGVTNIALNTMITEIIEQ